MRGQQGSSSKLGTFNKGLVRHHEVGLPSNPASFKALGMGAVAVLGSIPPTEQEEAAPAPAKPAWKAAVQANNASIQHLIDEQRKEQAKAAEAAAAASRRRARRAWEERDMPDTQRHLDTALEHMPNCEVLRRFRAHVRTKAGMLDEALEDAGLAVASNPGNPLNHRMHAICLQQKQKLPEAGVAFIASMKRGIPGQSLELGYNGLLNAISRDRRYFGDLRPAHRKANNSSGKW